MSNTTATRPARNDDDARDRPEPRRHVRGAAPGASTPLIVSMIASWLVGLAWPGLPAVVHAILATHPVADLWLVAYLVTQGVPTRRPLRLAPAAVTA